MPTLQNPLRRPKPARVDVVHKDIFQFGDEHARYASSVQALRVRLTAEELWISPELSIPLELVESADLITEGRLPPRRALRVIYMNPITGHREAVYLCKVMVCFYRTAPLEALRERIETERAQLAERQPTTHVELADDDVEVQCEVCGTAPAYYVGYRLLIGAFLISYLSEERRRTHCRWHNFLSGSYAYVVTVLVGWIGLSIVAWPFQVYRCALNMRPAVGRFAHVLGITPIAALAAVVWVVATGG